MRNQVSLLPIWKIVISILPVLALAVQWYTHACGLLLTYDSQQYLAAAASFKTSHVFVGTSGSSYSYWAPLFPMILSLFPDAGAWLMWLNFPLVLALFLLMKRLAGKVLESAFQTLVFLAFTFLGVHILMISVFLWSELIFMVLLIAFVLSIHSFNKSITHQWVAIALGFLMCLQRNAGLFIVIGSALWLFMSTVGSVSKKLRNAAVLFSCTFGLWFWNIYVSFSSTGGFKFYEQDFFDAVFHNIHFLLQSLQKAWLPFALGAEILVPLSLAAAWYLLRRKLTATSIQSLLLCVTLSYLLGMAVMFPLDINDGDRYISVVLPLITLFTLSGIETWLDSSKKSMVSVGTVLLMASLLYPISRTIKNAGLWHEMSCARVVSNK